MCGIAGIIDPRLSPDEVRSVLRDMTDVIAHRGPDDQGHVARHGAGIGMRRLSIIDVAGGQQPIANEDGSIHVICNGEIYNFDLLRPRLRQRGHVFATASDSEVLLHLYEDHGVDAFRELRGMFGAAIWDHGRRRLILGRDRLGKKPLYYAQLGDRFLFGSEMKSLLAAEPRLRERDDTQLAEYFQFGYLHEPNTIYRHIKKVPAGHFAVLEDGQLKIEAYWRLDFTTNDQRSPQQWCDELDHLLTEAVRVRLQSEVPLGVFLSGGIDSSAVVAYAHAAGLRPIKTFTIGFDRPAWDESEDALRVARHFDTDHHVLHLSEAELRTSLPETLLKLTRHFDEPFGDDSALPTYHVSKLAREHVTVILSGDGGDELFAGYSSYQGARFAQHYRRRLPFWLGHHVLPGMARTTARFLPEGLRYQALRVAKVLRDSSLPFERAYRDKTSIWNDRELRQLITPDLLNGCDYFGEQYLPDALWQIMQSDRDVVSRLTEIDIHSYLVDDILMKVDRMSMAHSLEVRSPLLDHHVVELAASMPTQMKLRGRVGKAVLRDVLARHLPPQTLTKRKQGFAVPLRDWFRHGLSEMVSDYLEYNGGRLPSHIFSQEKVQQILHQHRQGVADHGRKIWSLLSFAAWHDLYQTGDMSPCAASLESSI